MEQGSSLRVEDGGHVVHFYETEQSLVSLVAAYLAASLLDGDSVLVVATEAHREAFTTSLAGTGIDVGDVVDGGRLLFLDADRMLGEFMVAGIPSADRFDATVGSCVRRLVGMGRPVRAYGEMVARLWQESNVVGAVQLEALWNRLGELTPFGLFCAYPRDLMSDPAGWEAFGEVCDLHSHVVGGTPDISAEFTRRFVAKPQAARLARRYVSEILKQWGFAATDDAVIAVGELLANAVQHGGSYFGVGLTRISGGVRIMVSDSSQAAPRLVEPASSGLDGRGMRMVDTVATEWGCDFDVGGKVVWVELASRPRRGEERV